jgi:hypothetical protein
MATNNDNRVLSRTRARYLTDQEMKVVNGNGTFTTFSCTFDPRTGARDGDCD